MTRVVAIFGLALAALADAEAKPQAPIEACLFAAQTLEAMRACKGLVFAPCVKEPENAESTLGLVMCHGREGDVWQALLIARTAELNARDPHRAATLRSANQAWRAWIEAECNYHRSEAMGGSAEAVITTHCKSDLTAERVILLTWQARGNILY